MAKETEYFIVESSALPEVFLKVVEAKRLLETGEEQTVHGVSQRVGISRSAFYKYKDSVHAFRDMLRGRVVTIQILLRNMPGALSGVLSVLADQKANVLTINQGIPGDSVAVVTVSVETSGMKNDIQNLLDALKGDKMVVRCEVMAG